jgi:hypothetical protein
MDGGHHTPPFAGKDNRSYAVVGRDRHAWDSIAADGQVYLAHWRRSSTQGGGSSRVEVAEETERYSWDRRGS